MTKHTEEVHAMVAGEHCRYCDRTEVPGYECNDDITFLVKNIITWHKAAVKEAVEEVIENVLVEIVELHRLSETKASEHECSQEGYEYGLEDAIKAIRKRYNQEEE